MVPLQNFAAHTLAAVIRRQPHSPARTAFAWQLAVGPALARATRIDLKGDELIVRPRDARWAAEVARVADTILLRLQSSLGAATVRRIRIDREGIEHNDHA